MFRFGAEPSYRYRPLEAFLPAGGTGLEGKVTILPGDALSTQDEAV